MAFLAPVGAAIAGAFGTTGIAATTAAVASTAASVGGIYSLTQSQNQPQIPTLQQGPTPTVPSVAAVEATERANILRANQKRTKTILTNPLGETEGAGSSIVRKQLVGKLGL